MNEEELTKEVCDNLYNLSWKKRNEGSVNLHPKTQLRHKMKGDVVLEELPFWEQNKTK